MFLTYSCLDFSTIITISPTYFAVTAINNNIIIKMGNVLKVVKNGEYGVNMTEKNVIKRNPAAITQIKITISFIICIIDGASIFLHPFV